VPDIFSLFESNSNIVLIVRIVTNLRSMNYHGNLSGESRSDKHANRETDGEI